MGNSERNDSAHVNTMYYSIFCFSINEFLSGRWSADFFTFIRSQLISGINVNYSDFWHMITKRKNSENHGHFVLNCNFKKNPTTLFSIDSRFKKDNYNKLSTFWIRTQTYEFLIPSIINSRLKYYCVILLNFMQSHTCNSSWYNFT